MVKWIFLVAFNFPNCVFSNRFVSLYDYNPDTTQPFRLIPVLLSKNVNFHKLRLQITHAKGWDNKGLLSKG